MPLYFDYSDSKISKLLENVQEEIVYYGWRPIDSLCVHEKFSQLHYNFKFPTKATYMLISINRKIQIK